ncbi:MAG: hypothetical protein ACRCTE_09245 [Cellulosilyticaceae bacterium]
MEKNRNVSFLFAFIPGAGQMYLGLMKKGVCIMLLLAAISFVSNLLRMYSLEVLFPVIWFYSFFDTLRMRNLSWEQREVLDADFDQALSKLSTYDWRTLFEKYRVPICIVLIVLGIDILFSNLISPVLRMFNTDWIYNISYSLPKTGVGIALFVAGIYFFSEWSQNKKA